MQIAHFIAALEGWAHPTLQENYDNSGLLAGNPLRQCTGILVTLDATEEVIFEAISRGCNLVIAHHPIIFKGLTRLTGKTYIERSVIAAIKNDISIYALHTNLDNVQSGVNAAIAAKLGLKNSRQLLPKQGQFKKIITFAPIAHAETVRSALFEAGAGLIGNYSETSFNTEGVGTFKANKAANPFVGEAGKRHYEQEQKIEVVFPAWLQSKIVTAMKAAHPYEEVAYDILSLDNDLQAVGSGMIGELPHPMNETEFLRLLKKQFQLNLIRHTALTGKEIQKVALCGGAGSFLTAKALSAGAHAFVTADVKYHEFFDGEGQLLLADIGHWESEQFTIDLIHDFLKEKFPTFAVLKTGVKTNPVEYFI